VSPPDPRVRRAGPEDADAIAEVHVASWEAAYPAFLPARVLAARGRPRRVRLWRDVLREPPARQEVLVADVGGSVAGFASYGPSEDPDEAVTVGELQALYVAPEHWRRGVGTALLVQAEARLAALGFDSARLRVLAANEQARRFYEGAGWADAGADTEYEGAPTRCYRKPLGS